MDDMGVGMGSGSEDEWRVVSLDTQDEGTTVDVFPSIHGEGMITKKLLSAGCEYENPREGWAAELTYQARVVGGDGTPFDIKDHEIVMLVDGAYPFGVEQGIKTLRENEHAILTVQPDKAFGAEGDASKGVPPNSVVEYDITCHRVIEVTRLDEGRIIKRRMRRGDTKSIEKPKSNDEVRVRWKGWLQDEPSSVFADEAELAWTVEMNSEVPPVLDRLVSRMVRMELAEATVAPIPGTVVPGFERFGVPADRAIVLEVSLLGFVGVDDISEEMDGRVTRRVLVAGDGWEKPRKRYIVSVDVQCRTELEAAEPLVACEALELTVGKVGESSVLSSFRATCGGADIAAAIELALPKMQQGELSELHVRPFDGTVFVAVRLTLRSWRQVEPVPLTNMEVTRTVLSSAPPDAERYERPGPLASVEVRYTVRLAGRPDAAALESTADTPRSFVVSDGPTSGVLPCIDAGVREMKRGERAMIHAPTHWAYTSPEFVSSAEWPVPRGAVESTAAGGVEVELELLDFTRGKDYFALSGDEKMAEMAKYREAGNRLFKAGGEANTRMAIKRYEEAIRKEAREHDFSSLDAADKDARLAEVRRQKVATLLNLAASHLRLNGGKEVLGLSKEASSDVKAAVRHAKDAVDVDPTNVKALYRRGQARLLLGELDGARSDLLDAAKREPQNREVRKELERLKEANAKARQQSKALFGGMFNS